ncbi:MAG: YbgC/FadM family acyl-CoA thioesterase [Gammaproteobacteria bacterium]|nr:YbgC/FadM family acyl-CoA thioesterase [Gammaproteobacteria bacterium]MYD75311.1 YbgC/FadM family acyl-CoA thioesterase [Gammaproteobacteria bacterium]MYJ52138.1 YbgC/FadM family acyl-CoA thioesterase [Gammaproteobacteria bacterium]
MQRQNGSFSIRVPVNYEDTDAGGVVYYGNYLGYMERARNACLRFHGFPLTRIEKEDGMLFVVTNVELRYYLPARLDDELEVNLKVRQIRGARVSFMHQVLRGADRLVEGEIDLATVDSRTGRPCRIPERLKAGLRQHMAGVDDSDFSPRMLSAQPS